jgi:hypothetical protein
LLTPEHQKEALARAYVAAVAGRTGMTSSFRDFDYGIDVTLTEVAERARRLGSGTRYVESGHKLDIQIKSTTLATVEDQAVVFDLEVDAYDDLRETKVGTPRILVLLVLPGSGAEQLKQTEQALCLRQCCYWLSLKGAKRVKNVRTVRVRISRENIFSEVSLKKMMDRIKRGEPV